MKLFKLINEKKAIIESIDLYKKGLTQTKSTILQYGNADYYDDLQYLLQRIEIDLTPYRIIEKYKILKMFNKYLPIELLKYITSFLNQTIEDFAALEHTENNTELFTSVKGIKTSIPHYHFIWF
jgi:hypothetical protein